MAGGNYPIQLLCKIAGISRSNYYKWLKRQEFPTEKQLKDEEIKKKIMECHKKLKGIYGYRRIQIWLEKTYGLHMIHKRVQRLMGELGFRQSLEKRNPIKGRIIHCFSNHLNRFIINQFLLSMCRVQRF